MPVSSSHTGNGASVTKIGSNSYKVVSGATLITVGVDGSTINNIITGIGSAGTDNPATLLVSGAAVASASTSTSGGVVIAGGGGTALSGLAYNSGSFAAINDGVVNGVTIGNNGGLLASTISDYSGNPGKVISAHVLTGGHALAGGGFTIKGQHFTGSGIISGSTFDIGSTEVLESGGTDMSSVLGGTQIVSSGAYSMKSIFSAGTQIINGGVGSGNTATDNAVIQVNAGGSSLKTMVSGATIQATSGSYVSGLVLQNAVAAAYMGSVLSNVTVGNGATMTLESGATLYNATVSGMLTSGGTPGTLIVQSGAVISGTKIGWKGRIDVDTLTYNSGQKVSVTGGRISIVSGGSTLWSTGISTIGGSNTSADYHLERDSDGSAVIVYDKCYLAGTKIKCGDYQVSVELLEKGDMISCFNGIDFELKPITWVGKSSASVDKSKPIDLAGYPIRIVKNALGENSPDMDLLVTPEHCMLICGKFIPARMLVNNTSIMYDTSFESYDYYHVETETHSAILANNALSESFLDSGDKGNFNNDTVHNITFDELKDWSSAYAPLDTSIDFVKPIHQQLLMRAMSLGYENKFNNIARNRDLIRIQLPTGKVVSPTRTNNNNLVFIVDANTDYFYILSSAARPCDTVGPYMDDRRNLGVLVGTIQQWVSDNTHVIKSHLVENCSSWNNIENGEVRWTTGRSKVAIIPEPNISMVSIDIKEYF